MRNLPLQTHKLDWESGAPRSLLFHDCFRSLSGAIAESQHTFLKANNLPDAWSNNRIFQIGEIGFGTGLNFLLTKELWSNSRRLAGSRLYYLSFEKFPLEKSDIQKALEVYGISRDQRSELTKKYPMLLPGIHRVHFEKECLVLDLVFGDVLEWLPKLQHSINAWYLDGFSPKKNSELWSKKLFEYIADASSPGATYATYSSSSTVRNHLEQAGFSTERVPGTGAKRENLKGNLLESSQESSTPSTRTVAVIGSGLSGAFISHSLVKRGIEVSVFEQSNRIASGASGNPVAALNPYYSAHGTTLSRLCETGYQYSLHTLKNLQLEGYEFGFETPGSIHLPVTVRHKKLLEALPDLCLPEEFISPLSSAEATDIAGIPIKQKAFRYTLGALVNPARLCEICLEADGIRKIYFHTEVLSPLRKNDRWVIEAGNIHEEYDAIIICSGPDSVNISPIEKLPLFKNRGQIVQLKSNEQSKSLHSTLCFNGYLLPEKNGFHTLGASYDRTLDKKEPDLNVQKNLIANLHKTIPDLGAFPQENTLRGRVSFRATTPDRVPYAGEFSNYPGLYILAGFGSRGLSSIPLCAEMVASTIAHEPTPFCRQMTKALLPTRFITPSSKT